jgi:hypothetical protein
MMIVTDSKVVIQQARMSRVHKGKIENIQTPIDIHFACGCSFSLQPAGQVQSANPINQPKLSWLRCYDDLAGSLPDSNGDCPNVYCTGSDRLANIHAFPA